MGCFSVKKEFESVDIVKKRDKKYQRMKDFIIFAPLYARYVHIHKPYYCQNNTKSIIPN